MENIFSRIEQILDYKEKSAEWFNKEFAYGGYLSKVNRKTGTVNHAIIEKLIAKIPEINLYWLLTGKGSMLKETAVSKPKNEPSPELLRRFEELAGENALLKKEIEELKARLNDK